MNKLTLITGNTEKINIARAALQGTGIFLDAQKIACPEIQCDDIEEIAKFSAKYASNYLKSNVIKIDSGLFIEALDGFPGPYSEYVERKLKAEHIIRLMQGIQNRSAYYKEAMAYCEYGKEPIVFLTHTNGRISTTVDGNLGWEFDKIFIWGDDDKTMANFTDEQRACKYSHENWKRIRDYLKTAERTDSELEK